MRKFFIFMTLLMGSAAMACPPGTLTVDGKIYRPTDLADLGQGASFDTDAQDVLTISTVRYCHFQGQANVRYVIVALPSGKKYKVPNNIGANCGVIRSIGGQPSEILAGVVLSGGCQN